MSTMRTKLALALLGFAATACNSQRIAPDESTSETASRVVSISDVEWGPLNPARGKNGPKAADLWGDRTHGGPTGFLVEFVDGFESPPHIHNVSYRGVVISGLAHNDDPNAGEMWMPAGSYWTQPKGAVHITSAKGRLNRAYIEIEDGPYLVHPVADEFQTDEVPINVDVSNLVWLDPQGATVASGGAKVAYLWGDSANDQLNGALIKLPSGFRGVLRSHGSSLRAVVIAGQPQYGQAGESRTLEPGSHFSSDGACAHRISSGTECLLYLRANGRFDLVSEQH